MYKGALYEKILDGSAKLDAFYVTIGDDIYENTLIETVTINSDLLTGSTFSIGESAASTLEMRLILDSTVERVPFDKYASVRPWFRYKYRTETELSDGTIHVNETYEDIPYGVFYIDSIDDTTKSKVTIKASDAICSIHRLGSKFNIGDFVRLSTNSIDSTTLLKKMCEKLFIRLDTLSISKLSSFTFNSSDEELFKNELKYRDILNMILKYSGVYAGMDREGTLIFFDITDTKLTYDKTMYKINSLTKGNIPFKLDGMTCTVDSNNILKSGDYESLNGNISFSCPKMTQSRLSSIFNKYKSFSYFPIGVDILFNPLFDLGDKFSVKDYNGAEYGAHIFNYTFNYNGSINLSIQSEFNPVSVPTKNNLFGALTILSNAPDVHKVRIDTSEFSPNDITSMVTYLTNKGYNRDTINAVLGLTEELIPEDEINESNFDPTKHKKILVSSNLANGLFIGTNNLIEAGNCVENSFSQSDLADEGEVIDLVAKDFLRAVAMYSDFGIGAFSHDAKLADMKSPLNQHNYPDIVKHCSSKYGLDPSMVYALIRVEYGGDPYNTNSIDNKFIPYKSGSKYIYNDDGYSIVDNSIYNQVEKCCRALKESLVRWRYNYIAALMDYDMGEDAVSWIIGNYISENDIKHPGFEEETTSWSRFEYMQDRTLNAQPEWIRVAAYEELISYDIMSISKEDSFASNDWIDDWNDLCDSWDLGGTPGKKSTHSVEEYLSFYEIVNDTFPYTIISSDTKVGLGAIKPTKIPFNVNSTEMYESLRNSNARDTIVSTAKLLTVRDAGPNRDQYRYGNNITCSFKYRTVALEKPVIGYPGAYYNGIYNAVCFDPASLVSCAYHAAGLDSLYNKQTSIRGASTPDSTLYQACKGSYGNPVVFKCDFTNLDTNAKPGDLILECTETVNRDAYYYNSKVPEFYRVYIYCGKESGLHMVAYVNGEYEFPNALRYDDIGSCGILLTHGLIVRPAELDRLDKAQTVVPDYNFSFKKNTVFETSKRGYDILDSLNKVRDDVTPEECDFVVLEGCKIHDSYNAVYAGVDLIDCLQEKYGRDVKIYVLGENEVNLATIEDNLKTINKVNSESRFANIEYLGLNDAIRKYSTSTLEHKSNCYTEPLSGPVIFDILRKRIGAKTVIRYEHIKKMDNYIINPFSTVPENQYKLVESSIYDACGYEIENIEIELPGTPDDNDPYKPSTKYWMLIKFDTEIYAPTISSNLDITFKGDDCVDGEFTPVKNKRYNVHVYAADWKYCAWVDSDIFAEATVKEDLSSRLDSWLQLNDLLALRGGASIRYNDDDSKTPAYYDNPSANLFKWRNSYSNGYTYNINIRALLILLAMGYSAYDSPYLKSIKALKVNPRVTNTIRLTNDPFRYLIERNNGILESYTTSGSDKIEIGDVLLLSKNSVSESDVAAIYTNQKIVFDSSESRVEVFDYDENEIGSVMSDTPVILAEPTTEAPVKANYVKIYGQNFQLSTNPPEGAPGYGEYFEGYVKSNQVYPRLKLNLEGGYAETIDMIEQAAIVKSFDSDSGDIELIFCIPDFSPYLFSKKFNINDISSGLINLNFVSFYSVGRVRLFV